MRFVACAAALFLLSSCIVVSHVDGAGHEVCETHPTSSCTSPANAQIKVIMDHDGGVDDFIALTLLLSAHTFDIRAVTLQPADCFKHTATQASKLFLDMLGAHNVTVAASDNVGTNPFPDAWRSHSDHIFDLPILKHTPQATSNVVVPEDAAHHLVELLTKPGASYTILATGPLSNLADALALNPNITHGIERIYIMGGAIHVRGNVEEAEHDGSAEWNIYNNPQAAADVLSSGVPITLIPLDATEQVPYSYALIEQLLELAGLGAAEQQDGSLLQLYVQTMDIAASSIETGEYFFWDSLTAIAMIDPSVIATTPLRVKVVTSGPSQGRTIEAGDGALMDVALDAHPLAVERALLRTLGVREEPADAGLLGE